MIGAHLFFGLQDVWRPRPIHFPGQKWGWKESSSMDMWGWDETYQTYHLLGTNMLWKPLDAMVNWSTHTHLTGLGNYFTSSAPHPEIWYNLIFSLASILAFSHSIWHIFWLSGILWHVFGSRRAKSPLRSGSAHWDLELAVEAESSDKI